MKANTFAISKTKEFEEFQRYIKVTFNSNQRLPEQIFNTSFSGFVFEEFDWAMSADFWNTIQQLAIVSQDSFILSAVLEPHPIDYFYKEFGYYNWFKLPIELSSEDYWDVLQLEPEDSPADAMLYNSEVVVWVSSSMKWAIWGERNLGICVLAFKNGNKIIKDHPPIGKWRFVEEALTDLLPINFYGRQVPKDFSNHLRRNYNNK